MNRPRESLLSLELSAGVSDHYQANIRVLSLDFYASTLAILHKFQDYHRAHGFQPVSEKT